MTGPGILLTATVTGNGTFEVTELIRLTAPAGSLALAPADLSDIGRGFDGVRPAVSAFSATADNHRVSAPPRIDQRTRLRAPAAATRWALHYRLSGATVRSLPSRAGRALGALRPLSAHLPADLPVALAVDGRPVINLFCPNLALADQVCYVGAPPHLRVNRPLKFHNAVVLVQLNLTTSP